MLARSSRTAAPDPSIDIHRRNASRFTGKDVSCKVSQIDMEESADSRASKDLSSRAEEACWTVGVGGVVFAAASALLSQTKKLLEDRKMRF